MKTVWTKGTASVAAFLLGIALTGIAAGHGGSGQVLHSGHSDSMRGNLTAKDFRYRSPKTSRLVIPGTAFHGRTHISEFQHDLELSSIIVPNSNYVVAPVFLPDGAQVKSIQWFHSDDNETGTFQMHASFFENGEPAFTLMSESTVNAGCSQEPCVVADSTVDASTINNRSRHYSLNVSGGETTVFKAVVIYSVARVTP